MRIDILTLFPKMFEGVLGESIIKRARKKGKVDIRVHNLRDWTDDKHRKVDDKPFGGGPGMVIKPQPLFDAVSALKRGASRVVLMTPQGKTLTQSVAKKISGYKHIIIVCGHYEGIDERFRRKLVTDEISLGDFVLTGGEIPAMALVDSLVRLVPGVVGDRDSLEFESFASGLLEYPQYTRPAEFRGLGVPGVLLSGDHNKIDVWRREMAMKRTRSRRPDMYKKMKEKK
ncbi:MAG: tRNA (guanosine(37)-N1)-methyltransferase TrmD [Omnitrophica WOR_2 bacterium RIFCSPHIGHO2_01_FULL_49_10]|nr:MAG: tRNA (guanosine(37)-N1)-methyltransferase TrmD [Omnitrophica WOR_2 bacterium RIFCSPHIGHO2_01_FULL_49_10]